MKVCEESVYSNKLGAVTAGELATDLEERIEALAELLGVGFKPKIFGYEAYYENEDTEK